MGLELALMAVLYQSSNTNPFPQSSPIYILFLTSLCCHVVVTMADMSLPPTIIIFHFSGVVACETLLWILLPVFWKWFLINLFPLLVILFCFFNFIDYIPNLFRSNDSLPPPNLKQEEA
jgi:hypothetical protein